MALLTEGLDSLIRHMEHPSRRKTSLAS